MIFKDKLALLKRELEIAPATPAIPAVAEANQLMGITPGPGESLHVWPIPLSICNLPHGI